MNHNPHKFKAGDHAILDKDYRNAGEVIIDFLSPNEMYAHIYSADEKEMINGAWDVMTNRLTPISNETSRA